jgi:hypothetical protein
VLGDREENLQEWEQMVNDVSNLKKEKDQMKKKNKKKGKGNLEILSGSEKPDCKKLMCRRFEVGLILNRFFEFEHGWELTKDFVSKYKKNLR